MTRRKCQLPAVSGLCAGLVMTLLSPVTAAQHNSIRLPEGVHSTVFADIPAIARHIAVADNGNVYVALNDGVHGKGVAALRDNDGDGVADEREYFGEVAGTGIALHEDYLYFGSNTRVVRWQRGESELAPGGDMEVVVDGFEDRGQHAAKAVTFDDKGNLYVNVGAPSNACQLRDRERGSPGQEPCPLLEEFAGVWRYAADKTGQRHPHDGERYVTGVRNAVALEWSRPHDALYLVQHGRDQLDALYPELFTTAERIDQPAEEFHRLERGSNLGWPCTYWDPIRDARMIAPEYGGDGETIADNNDYQDPLIGFPAHWGPNDLLFYTGGEFPAEYRNGVFIAFHGSWNRAPQPQAGYRVVFSPTS